MNRFELIVGVLDYTHVETALPDQLLSLDEATWLLELSHHFNEHQLWSAIDAGTLGAEKIGKSLYVTRAGVARWREGSKVNRRRSEPTIETPAAQSKALASQAAARQVLAVLRATKR